MNINENHMKPMKTEAVGKCVRVRSFANLVDRRGSPQVGQAMLAAGAHWRPTNPTHRERPHAYRGGTINRYVGWAG